jgi:hypothetical protein
MFLPAVVTAFQHAAGFAGRLVSTLRLRLRLSASQHFG